MPIPTPGKQIRFHLGQIHVIHVNHIDSKSKRSGRATCSSTTRVDLSSRCLFQNPGNKSGPHVRQLYLTQIRVCEARECR